MQRLTSVALTTILAVAATGAYAKGLRWADAPPVMPTGAKMALVSGDPNKEGSFVLRIKLPANYTVPPHTHPKDETVRVLSAGQLNYGMGDKLDKANAGTLAKGYHVTMMAGMNHWVFTTDPIEIQVSGEGPFAMTYANPADDPRNAK